MNNYSIYQQSILKYMNTFEVLTPRQLMEFMQLRKLEEKQDVTYEIKKLIGAGMLYFPQDGNTLRLTQRTRVNEALIDCIWVFLEYLTEQNEEKDYQRSNRESELIRGIDVGCISIEPPYLKPLQLVYANENGNSVYYFATIDSIKHINQINVLREHLLCSVNPDAEEAPTIKVIIITWDMKTASNLPRIPEFDTMVMVLSRQAGFENQLNDKPKMDLYNTYAHTIEIKDEAGTDEQP